MQRSRLSESRRRYNLTDEVVLKGVQLAPGGEVRSVCSKIDFMLYSEKGTAKERVVPSQVVAHILRRLGNQGKVEIERRNGGRSMRFWPLKRESQ
jgi:hypothetical protein